MDMMFINSTISSIKTIGEIAKSFIELKSMSDVQAKVVELQSAILSAQDSAFSAHAERESLTNEVRILKEEISSMKSWEVQKKRYKLISPWPGSVVYALKESMKDGEPPHWICTQCYEGGKRSILQSRERKGGFPIYVCGVCSAELHDPYREIPHMNYAAD